MKTLGLSIAQSFKDSFKARIRREAMDTIDREGSGSDKVKLRPRLSSAKTVVRELTGIAEVESRGYGFFGDDNERVRLHQE
jgi:hypothetical protein